MKKKLSHITREGKLEMVDVSAKEESVRTALAQAVIEMSPHVVEELTSNGFHTKKGSIIDIAVVAGIQGAKKTSELIPLCHNIFIDKIDVEINPVETGFEIKSFAKTIGKTGIEMEALTAVTVAALCIYDMTKALDHNTTIKFVQLSAKTGGKNDFSR